MLSNKFSKNLIRVSLGLVIAGTALVGCDKNDAVVTPTPTPAARPNQVFYALTNDNKVVMYNAQTAETAGTTLNVTGLQAGERLLSIDFRPSTGQLYALGSSSRIYFIDLNSGAATAPNINAFTPALVGTIANIDFNPTVDRIRLVTNSGQNLRLNPETGATAAVDGVINGGSNPAINSIAYTNNNATATATELYDIDATTKKLYKQNPPNNGTLTEVGTIPVNFQDKAGFDINADNSVALATFVVGGVTKLYTIDLANANATFLANMADGIIDIAIPTLPVAYATTAMGGLQVFNPLVANSAVTRTITGLGAGESILGIDFRPVNGQLYGIAATAAGAAKLYTFNLATGAATGIGAGFNIGAGITAAGFDFNPTVDRIRFVANNGANLRLNPNDGSIAATDLSLNPGTPMVTSAAYTNNFAGTTSTVLYVADATTLYIQNPPNNGTLVPVGPLGITVGANNGFDIGGRSNSAFAIHTVGTATKVYTINLATGAATAGVDYPNAVTGMAVGLGF
ncbi:DUF4394 domain-containing protein [Ferruginibacter yonginensis]|uniref:DUF4394 domain-containing protein n=1 Tax=Ferruginibacter yonginensis TaxID=1310416 RepID=A0ABV8QLZ6_9BACT